MKLVRYGNIGNEKPGILDRDGKIRDLSNYVPDIDGSTLEPVNLEKIANFDIDSLRVIEGSPRLGAPVARIGKLVCIGLNYRLHAKETGAIIPEEPVIFMKATTSIIGPNDDVVIPRGSVKTDWEVELAVAIGSVAQYVDEENALDYVAGYCVANDVSEREFQIERSGSVG